MAQHRDAGQRTGISLRHGSEQHCQGSCWEVSYRWWTNGPSPAPVGMVERFSFMRDLIFTYLYQMICNWCRIVSIGNVIQFSGPGFAELEFCCFTDFTVTSLICWVVTYLILSTIPRKSSNHGEAANYGSFSGFQLCISTRCILDSGCLHVRRGLQIQRDWPAPWGNKKVAVTESL